MGTRAEINLAPGLFVVLAAMGCYESHDLPVVPEALEPGAPCRDSSECTGRLACIVSARFPGGYCSELCSAGCPEGTRCDLGFGEGLCLAECTSARDCRPGYSCFGDVCRPPCITDEECGSGAAICIRGECTGGECMTTRDCAVGRVCIAGRCLGDTDGGSDLPIGAPCRAGRECATGLCLSDELGGTCATPCGSRRDCAVGQPCAPAWVDADGDGRNDFVMGGCVSPNLDGRLLAGSCSSGLDCESRVCADRQCVEACTDTSLDCLPGHTCTLLSLNGVVSGEFSGCGFTLRSDPIAVEDFEVGPFPLAAAGLGMRINVAVPNDAESVTFIATHAGGDRVPIGYQSLFSPDEAVLFDLVSLGEWVDQPVRWLPLANDEAATISVPSSTPDRLPMVPGRYGVRVLLLGDGEGDARASEIRLTMRVKRARRIDRGTIDLAIYPVGVGFDAAGARAETRLTNTIANLRDIFDAVGLSLGVIAYRDVPAAVVSRLSVIDSTDGADSELAELFRLSSDASPNVLPLFLVRSIATSGPDGGVALGVAGGIPGPPGLSGTMHSGVAISYDAAIVGSGATGERNVAQIMAHEGSHFLGLYHNRERLRPCPAGTGPTMADPCAPFGGEDVIADTSRSDGDNLMWWALGGDTGRRYNVTLTDGQAYVLLRSPLVGR